ncbi:CLUMA_CG004910, isoform A [Clunio marinus]|uniref:CLUMA_CG004910, isoform A n=1 Tax=Clunio marinus TaxID=568069 RepID=A0A1J1HV51_9DIPT|nr:CLUMA_CG004910, isoform A [Clunio marinus]
MTLPNISLLLKTFCCLLTSRELGGEARNSEGKCLEGNEDLCRSYLCLETDKIKTQKLCHKNRDYKLECSCILSSCKLN